MNQKLLYLSKSQVEAASPDVSEVIGGLEHMFKLKGQGQVEMPPKPGIHTQADSFIHAMPAYIPEMNVAGMKWISGYPDNFKMGLPYITGLLILNDPQTGIPLTVMDATHITAVRTGAATAVAAKYLARKDSQTLGLVACGVQGVSNLSALKAVFDLKKVKVFDIDEKKADAFAKKYTQEFELEIERVKTPKEAVKGLDLVVTSGPILKKPTPVIEKNWLTPGSFYCPLDFDSYFTGSAFDACDLLLTDDVTQLNYYRKSGYFAETPEVSYDLGHLLSGQIEGRTSDEQITMAINLGLALDDMVMAKLVYERAIKMNLGTRLDL